jgi:hypothetical protein
VLQFYNDCQEDRQRQKMAEPIIEEELDSQGDLIQPPSKKRRISEDSNVQKESSGSKRLQKPAGTGSCTHYVCSAIYQVTVILSFIAVNPRI